MVLAEPPADVVTTLDVAPVAAPREEVRRAPWRRTERAAEAALIAIAVAATAVGIIVRFTGPRALWLDEALTVNISRLPLPRLFDALRHDGSPPGYYLLLHYWMGLFGTGTRAVRALPAVLSVLTLGVAWRLGNAVGGRRVGAILVVVLACNPFALRYGTENRMYAFVMLLAAGVLLAVVRTLQHPSLRRLLCLGLLSGLLLLAHYWAIYLVGALAAVLLVASWRGPVRSNARMALLAVAAGGLLFLPWAPSFVFQALHTGTPWATPINTSLFLWTLGEFAGWERRLGAALFAAYCCTLGLVLVAVALRWSRRGRRVADVVGWRRPVPGSRFVLPTAAVFVITLALALVGGLVAHSAFAFRYASVVLPALVLLVALGIAAVDRTRLGRTAGSAVLAAVAVLGTVTGAEQVNAQRTQAIQVATAIANGARPGDVVAYCPDQLGPAVSRLLPDRLLTQITFPRFDDPQRINWVDYGQVNAAANPGVFANEVLSMAAGHQIWLVWEAGYRTFGRDCEQIRDAMEVARPNVTEAVTSDPRQFYEHESVVRFAP